MSRFPLAFAILEVGVTLAVVILVAWVGILYHRALRLPRDQQQHAIDVLSELTDLLRTVRGAARLEGTAKESQGPRGRTSRRVMDRGGRKRSRSVGNKSKPVGDLKHRKRGGSERLDG